MSVYIDYDSVKLNAFVDELETILEKRAISFMPLIKSIGKLPWSIAKTVGRSVVRHPGLWMTGALVGMPGITETRRLTKLPQRGGRYLLPKI